MLGDEGLLLSAVKEWLTFMHLQKIFYEEQLIIFRLFKRFEQLARVILDQLFDNFLDG